MILAFIVALSHWFETSRWHPAQRSLSLALWSLQDFFLSWDFPSLLVCSTSTLTREFCSWNWMTCYSFGRKPPRLLFDSATCPLPWLRVRVLLLSLGSQFQISSCSTVEAQPSLCLQSSKSYSQPLRGLLQPMMAAERRDRVCPSYRHIPALAIKYTMCEIRRIIFYTNSSMSLTDILWICLMWTASHMCLLACNP